MSPPTRSAAAALCLLAIAWGGAAPARAGDLRVHVIAAGPGAEAALQERLVDAAPGDVIQLEEGTYRLTHQLDVVAASVTIRGRGSARTVLSFRGQSAGSSGILATGDNFTLEHLAVEDTAGDAVKVLGSRNVTFRDVRTEWTGPASASNGAYGLYPVQCRNVLVEGCTAIGASDAGLYVGQCRDVVVRGCLAERNVAGIEIENSVGVDVHGNLARDNAGGILVFDLPGLPVTNGGGVRVFRNRSVANNHDNFADPGSMVASVPPGTGVMILATDRVEVFDNDVVANDSAGVLVISFTALGKKLSDARYDPVPEAISIHDNRFADGGSKPRGELGLLLVPLLGARLPDILWDGVVPEGTAAPPLRLERNGAATFADFRIRDVTPLAVLTGAARPRTDPGLLSAALEALPEIVLEPHDPPGDELPPAVRFYRGLPRRLSALGLFSGPPSAQEPAPGVVPYRLATELWSDGSHKRRFIRLPEGERMGYRDDGALDFPVGTTIAKTFSFPAAAGGAERLVETRIERREPEGWFGVTYLWDDAGTDAELCLGGRTLALEVAGEAGATRALRYEVPGANQCLACHAQLDAAGRPAYEPLGPTAANMTCSAPGDDADEPDQLARFAAAGLLAGLPDARPAGLPAAHDPAAGTIDDRARGWLAVNCAHCHNPAGSARTTGLDLRRAQSDPGRLGVWKTPVAAGRGAGGRAYDVVPGQPDDSILVHRLEAAEPAVAMPSLGRTTVDEAGVRLVRAWIEGLPPGK